MYNISNHHGEMRSHGCEVRSKFSACVQGKILVYNLFFHPREPLPNHSGYDSTTLVLFVQRVGLRQKLCLNSNPEVSDIIRGIPSMGPRKNLHQRSRPHSCSLADDTSITRLIKLGGMRKKLENRFCKLSLC